MKKIRVIDFFITFASDTTLAHAVSRHLEVFVKHFFCRDGKYKGKWDRVSRHNIKAFT